MRLHTSLGGRMSKYHFLFPLLIMMMGCGNPVDGPTSLAEHQKESAYDQIRVGTSYQDVAGLVRPAIYVQTNQNGTITYDHLFDPALMYSGASEITNGVTLTVEGDRIVFKAPIVIVRW